MGILDRLLGRKSAGMTSPADLSYAVGGAAGALRGLGGINFLGALDLGKEQRAPQTDAARIAAVMSHPVAYMCVRKIAWSAASVPWQASVYGQQIEPDHPVVKLLNRPNPSQSRWDFYSLVASSLAVCGNAYLLIVPSILMTNERERSADNLPGSLVFLRPDLVQMHVDPSTNRVDYYDYQTPAGTKRLEPGAVIHIRHRWLHSDHDGLSVVHPAFEPLSLYSSLTSLSRKLAQNVGGVPGMLVFSQSGGMSDAQRQEMDEHLRRFRTDGDRFAELLMVDIDSGDVKFVPVGGDISKLTPTQSKADASREIANLFGVPPLLLTQGENATFANQSEAMRSFWLETLVPGYLQPIGDALGQALGGIEVTADLSDVAALSSLNQQVVSTLSAANWLTINEKRAVMNYPPVPMGDRVLSSLGTIALDTQIASSDATAVQTHPPELLQAIIGAANEAMAMGKADREILADVIAKASAALAQQKKG